MARNRWLALGMVGLASLVATTGCETDSYFDPSVVGRWEQTPVTLPILSRLELIEPVDDLSIETTPVRPEDLVPDKREYVIGTGDVITVSIFELLNIGQDFAVTRQVEQLGTVRIPNVGSVQAQGFTAAQMENELRETLERLGILRNAQVSVLVNQSQRNTYSVLGSPEQGRTAIGTYVIPRPDFRLLDALALARGVPGRTKTLLIIRQTALTPEVAGEPLPASVRQDLDEPTTTVEPAPTDPSELIDRLLEGIEPEPAAVAPRVETPAPRDAPSAVEEGLDAESDAGQWVFVGGRWVRIQPKETRELASTADAAAAEEERLASLRSLITQRIIQVPYERLINGDMSFNLVIRPGDIIKVPDPTAGFVYIMGAIGRPGAYTVPGEEDLTLKQLVASAGNLSGLAIPERVDLVRRVGNNREATIRLNLRAIFEGVEPDFFLKQNDLINVGTNFIATPLAVFRNGLRFTYGMGFIIDENFADQIF
ncbi:MAG: polysaccharide biosynthesis/export family protein [Planctomycetota bacterium]